LPILLLKEKKQSKAKLKAAWSASMSSKCQGSILYLGGKTGLSDAQNFPQQHDAKNISQILSNYDSM
jgi:hypothetical protein